MFLVSKKKGTKSEFFFSFSAANKESTGTEIVDWGDPRYFTLNWLKFVQLTRVDELLCGELHTPLSHAFCWHPSRYSPDGYRMILVLNFQGVELPPGGVIHFVLAHNKA